MKPKLLLKILSIAGLFLTVLPSFFVFNRTLDLDDAKNIMLLGTFVWFVISPFWMNKNPKS